MLNVIISAPCLSALAKMRAMNVPVEWNWRVAITQSIPTAAGDKSLCMFLIVYAMITICWSFTSSGNCFWKLRYTTLRACEGPSACRRSPPFPPPFSMAVHSRVWARTAQSPCRPCTNSTLSCTAPASLPSNEDTWNRLANASSGQTSGQGYK